MLCGSMCIVDGHASNGVGCPAGCYDQGMMRWLSRWLMLPVLMLGACAIPDTLEMLDDSAPPPEFGRPLWVRGCAGFGGLVGGVVGGVASVATLPITYPLSVWAEDGLGELAQGELLLAPAVGLAAVGHCALGIPADVLDWLFYRAWVEPIDPITSYELIPLKAPELPKPVAPQSDG